MRGAKNQAMEAAPPLMAPVSLGELVDRITILEIKSRRLVTPRKRTASRRDMLELRALAAPYCNSRVAALQRRLYLINATLWECEERVRRGPGRFAPYLQKRIHTLNDQRHRVKHKISKTIRGGQLEFKSYV